MIACNPRVYIESGNGTIASLGGVSEEGYGVLFMNPTKESVGIGPIESMPDDFDQDNAAITWVFKNTQSLNVIIEQLIQLRVNMETYAKEVNPDG